MSERFDTYFAKLEALSAEELDRSTGRLIVSEKRHVAQVVAHIAEISRRKAALRWGFKGVFDYCVQQLNLSEASAALRIQVANVARRLPEVLTALAENRLSLSALGRLAPCLGEENVTRILADCEGKTRREVEEYVVRLRPKPTFKPSIRKRPQAGANRVSEQQELSVEEEKEAEPTKAPSPSILELAREEEYNFRFSAKREFKEKLERLGEVLGVENAQRHLAEILEEALEIALEKKDPKKRHARRAKREQRSRQIQERGEKTSPRPDNVELEKETPKRSEPSRHVPAASRDRTFERAGYQCEFRAPDGRRCTQRVSLTIEHKRLWANAKSHDEEDLLCYCAAHNLLAAEDALGEEFVARKIERRAQSAVP